MRDLKRRHRIARVRVRRTNDVVAADDVNDARDRLNFSRAPNAPAATCLQALERKSERGRGERSLSLVHNHRRFTLI